jgi:hypothetical protein
VRHQGSTAPQVVGCGPPKKTCLGGRNPRGRRGRLGSKIVVPGGFGNHFKDAISPGACTCGHDTRSGGGESRALQKFPFRRRVTAHAGRAEKGCRLRSRAGSGAMGKSSFRVDQQYWPRNHWWPGRHSGPRTGKTFYPMQISPGTRAFFFRIMNSVVLRSSPATRANLRRGSPAEGPGAGAEEEKRRLEKFAYQNGGLGRWFPLARTASAGSS